MIGFWRPVVFTWAIKPVSSRIKGLPWHCVQENGLSYQTCWQRWPISSPSRSRCFDSAQPGLGNSWLGDDWEMSKTPAWVIGVASPFVWRSISKMGTQSIASQAGLLAGSEWKSIEREAALINCNQAKVSFPVFITHALGYLLITHQNSLPHYGPSGIRRRRRLAGNSTNDISQSDGTRRIRCSHHGEKLWQNCQKAVVKTRLRSSRSDSLEHRRGTYYGTHHCFWLLPSYHNALFYFHCFFLCFLQKDSPPPI